MSKSNAVTVIPIGKVSEVKDTIDFKLNRKDVINIFIQENLSELNLQVSTLTAKKLDLLADLRKVQEDDAAKKKAYYQSLLPADFKKLKLIFNSNQSNYGRRRALQFFNAEHTIEVVLHDVLVEEPKSDGKYDKVNAEIQDINNQLSELQAQITKVKGSEKQTEALIVKSMLQNTEDGQSLLNLISKNKQLQLK